MNIRQVDLLEKITRPSGTKKIVGIRQLSLRSWGRLAKYFNNELWDEANELANSMRGSYLTYIGFAEGHCKEIDEMNQAVTYMSGVVSDSLDKFLEQLEDDDKRQEIQNYLESENQSIETLDNLKERLSEKDLTSRYQGITEKQVIRLNKYLSYATALGVNGYWGGFLATYNHYYQQYRTTLTSYEIDESNIYLNNIKDKILDLFLNLYSFYVNENQEMLFSQCISNLFWLESKLDRLARLCALIAKTLEESLDQNRVTPRKIGTSALNSGRIARHWAFLAALSMYSINLALLPSTSREVEERFSEAKKLSFNSVIDDGRNITVKKILSDVVAYKDRYLEVKGFVRDSKTTRTDDGKLLSHFSLVSPSGKERIPIVAIYENLKHVGITDNSYVNINGHWKTDSALSDEPFLQIARIRFSEVSRRSWIDSMIDIISPWFELYPNSLYIEWSISPEDKGDGDQKSPRTGAGEIIFKEKFGLRRK